MQLQQAIFANSMKLGIFALITAGILAFTYIQTKPTILEQIRKAEEKALLEIVPKERHSNNMLDDVVTLSTEQQQQLHLVKRNKAFVARQDGKPVAVILPVIAPDGYSGAIKMIVGINVDGTVAGVRVVDHNETPGLGDGINLKKSDWILSFNGKSIGNPSLARWKVKKDKGEFDQFTGATITPRAVVKQVLNSLQFYEANKTAMFPDLFPTASIDKTITTNTEQPAE